MPTPVRVGGETAARVIARSGEARASPSGLVAVTLASCGRDSSTICSRDCQSGKLSGLQAVEQQLADEFAIAQADRALIEVLAHDDAQDRHAVDEELAHADDRKEQKWHAGAAKHAILHAG